MVTMRMGVLALQGDFAAHIGAFGDLGVTAREVRRPHELEDLDGLVIPGGESTTLLRFLDFEPRWWSTLGRYRQEGGAILGTCAGLILLAAEVRHPTQPSLGFLDVTVERNGYGRQIDSFASRGAWSDGAPLEMVFIRAPRIVRLGEGVEVLAHHRDEPVLVREGRVLAATFHPELTGDRTLHRRFVEIAAPSPADGVTSH
jgi:5'-phosphate synthase pdxT subunit